MFSELNRRNFLKSTLFAPLLPTFEPVRNHSPVINFKDGLPINLEDVFLYGKRQELTSKYLLVGAWINEIDAVFHPVESCWQITDKVSRVPNPWDSQLCGNFIWGEVGVMSDTGNIKLFYLITANKTNYALTKRPATRSSYGN